MINSSVKKSRRESPSSLQRRDGKSSECVRLLRILLFIVHVHVPRLNQYFQRSGLSHCRQWIPDECNRIDCVQSTLAVQLPLALMIDMRQVCEYFPSKKRMSHLYLLYSYIGLYNNIIQEKLFNYAYKIIKIAIEFK